MEAKKYQAFWRGAIILTIASFVTKVLSAFYRIPYQNIAGDVGFYIYQQIYPFYGFCLILATYGFPIIISKMVAERLERGKQQEASWSLIGIVRCFELQTTIRRVALIFIPQYLHLLWCCQVQHLLSLGDEHRRCFLRR